MFTGLVEGFRPVRTVRAARGGLSLSVDLGPFARGVRTGDSISVSGVCLTVEARAGATARFFLSRETLRRTTLGRRRPGDRVNLERSLRLGERLGGHLVYGHVDGVGTVRAIRREGRGATVVVETPAGFARYLVPKGSIAVDGVSLTVASVSGRAFEAALIPETLRRTTLAAARVGARVHLEADAVGKWIDSLLARRRSRGKGPRRRVA